jgi:hypothetical protein
MAALLGLFLAGCASAPSRINNACAIFDQRDGLFNNWSRDAKAASRKYGVPVPVMMATIYVESSFQPYARPQRTKLLGFIPWKRRSTAYGYAQALDGTWKEYQKETRNWSGRRSNFGDAIDFVGWYHSKSSRVNGISLNDPYNLYLAYYSGHRGYSRGVWKNNGPIKGAAAKSSKIASNYAAQLRTCGY